MSGGPVRRRMWYIAALAVTAVVVPLIFLLQGSPAHNARSRRSSPQGSHMRGPSASSTTTGPVDDLRGIGATITLFSSSLSEDSGTRAAPCSHPDTCFGPSVPYFATTLDTGTTYQFTSVSTQDGLVTGYVQHFAPSTSVASAEQQILAWMPGDATAGSLSVDINGGTCAQYDLTSSTLGGVVAGYPSIGDAAGVVGVEVTQSDVDFNITYDPTDVQEAQVGLVPRGPTSTCGEAPD